MGRYWSSKLGGRVLRWPPHVLTLAYVLVASAWVLGAAHLLQLHLAKAAGRELADAAVGLLFVAISATFMFVALSRAWTQQRRSRQAWAAAVDARRAAEAMLHEIVDTSSDAIFAMDRNGRYLLLNREAERILGQPTGLALGRDDGAFLPPAQVIERAARARAVMAADALRTDDELVCTVDGERVHHTVRGPLHDAHGAVRGTFAIARDVTVRRQAEARMMLATKSFELAGYGKSISDARTDRFLDVNPTFARERGWQRDELVGRSIFDVYPPRLHDQVRDIVVQLRQTDHLVLECEHQRRDGSVFPVLLDVTVTRDVDGVAQHRLVHAIDISARRRAEEAAALWASAFAQTGFAVAIADRADDALLDVNPAFAAMQRSTRDALRGQALASLFAPPLGAASTAAGSAELHGERTLLRADGTRLPVRVELTDTAQAGRALRIVHLTELSLDTVPRAGRYDG